MKENTYKQSESIVTFNPNELVKETNVNIDMGSSNCTTIPVPYTYQCTNYEDDSILLIIFVLLLASYLNRRGLGF